MKGDRLGPYRVLGELGSGSTARVYLGEVVGEAPGLDPGRRVALKILHPQFEAAPHVLQRFRQEVRVGRALRHRNVVRLLDAGAFQLAGRMRHFLAMEYVEGRTLREVIAVDGGQPEGLCRHVGCEVACGLTAIHRSGAVHRDIKPENIVLTKDEHVKIMDLGVARLRDESARFSQCGDFVGSVLYAAPEQFRGPSQRIDGRADLYALGFTLYELATGVHPFERDTIEEVMRLQLSEVPRTPSALQPRISPFFEYVLLRLLRKVPAQRFQSAESLCRILEEAEESSWWRERSHVLRLASRQPRHRPRIPRETAVYGREPELRRFRALWDDVTQGHGRVLVLEGEAGIGKSRLVDELVVRLDGAGEDLHALYGAWPSVGPATATGALCTAYREHLGAEDLEEALAPFLTDAPVLVRPFAAFLRGEPPPAGADPLDLDTLHTAFLHVTRALSLEKPTLVVLEDLQHATPEGRDVVTTLAQGTRNHRVLLVLTMRTGARKAPAPERFRLESAGRLVLDRLREQDVRDLLGEALGSAILAGQLAPRLTAHSDGNPLFLLEILQGLKKSGRLARKEGTSVWTLRGTLGDVHAPPRMRDLVQARLAGLSTEDREVLEAAATFGFEFAPALLAEVLDRPRLRVLQTLGRLERSHCLVHTRGQGCSFDHHVLQEILYGDLPPFLRRAYHAAIGEALQRGSGGSGPAGADAAAACHHLLLAGRGGAAVAWLDAALDHLEEGHQNARAAELIDRVLAVSGLVDRSPRARLLLRKAERLRLMGRAVAEVRTLEEAVRMASPKHDPLLASKASARLGDHLRVAGHPDRALGFLNQAVTLAGRAGSPRAEAEATSSLGVVLDDLGRYDEARDVQRRCLVYARRTGDRRAEARARANLAGSLLRLGEPERALEELGASVSLFEITGAVQERGRAEAELGATLVSLGRYDEARRHVERGLETACVVGYRAGEAAALSTLGALSQSRGDLAGAAAFVERGLAVQRECGRPLELGRALTQVGALEFLLGRAHRARPFLEEARERLRAVGNRLAEAWAVCHLARIEDEEGGQEASGELFREALGLSEQAGSVRDEVAIRMFWALGLFWTHEPDTAAEVLEDGGEAWRTAGSRDAVVLGRSLELALGRDDNEGAARRLLASPTTPFARYEAHALLHFARGWVEDLESAFREIVALRERAPADVWSGFLRGLRVRRRITEAWEAVHASDARAP